MVDRRGDVTLVRARPDEEWNRTRGNTAIGHRAQFSLDRDFAHGGRHVEQAVDPFVGGNVGEKRVNVGNADPGQHHFAFDCVEWQIAHGYPSVLR